jgi:tetratricopeptide (TPR) repeat protein
MTSPPDEPAGGAAVPARPHPPTERLLERADALAHFHRSLEFQPESARTCYYLGEALNLTGDLPGARAALERALRADPKDPRSYHLLGCVLDRLGFPEDALEMYRHGREVGGT